MRLNVGCGKEDAPGWVSLHQGHLQLRHPLPSLIRDVTHVYLGNVLEFMPFFEIEPALTALWERCTPDAKIAVVGPDCDKAREMDRRAQLWGIPLNKILHGQGRWANDVHLWECTPVRLRALLTTSGAQSVRSVDVSNAPELDLFPVTNRVAWQCAVVADLEKP